MLAAIADPSFDDVQLATLGTLTAEACDVTVSVPPLGDVTSLNASVATGVLISRLTSLK